MHARPWSAALLLSLAFAWLSADALRAQDLEPPASVEDLCQKMGLTCSKVKDNLYKVILSAGDETTVFLVEVRALNDKVKYVCVLAPVITVPKDFKSMDTLAKDMEKVNNDAYYGTVILLQGSEEKMLFLRHSLVLNNQSPTNFGLSLALMHAMKRDMKKKFGGLFDQG